MRHLIIFTMLVGGLSSIAVSQTPDSTKTTTTRKLIEQLADKSYAMRVRAQKQLRRMGLEAFDELQAATDSETVEIAAAARYLVSSLLVSWSKETDAAEVREILFEYGAQNAEERQSRIMLLAELPERKGLAALARLARFETSATLNHLAALELMQQSMSDDQATRNRHAAMIMELAQDSRRKSIQWLKVYAGDLESGDYAAEKWEKLVQQQRTELDALKAQSSSGKSVLDLVRVCAKRANLQGHRDAALKLAGANIDLIPPTTRDLNDACNWAIDNRLHEFVLELQSQHQNLFSKHAGIIYAVAESRKVALELEEAEKLAKKALAIRPFPATEEELAKIPPSALDEIAQAHREIGQELEARGLFEWAESEYRVIIDNMKVESLVGVSARQHLGRMLGELHQHDRVVELYSPIIERSEQDSAFKDRLRYSSYNLDFFRSETEYHRSMKLLKAEKLAEARPMLMRSYNLNDRNIDILIQMYRTKGDKEWTELVNNTLSRAIRESESKIKSAELRAQGGIQGVDHNRSLALALNQYAWLVSNTEGDLKRALRESLRSLKLTPNNAAQLDTAARCYLALGQFEEARKMQLKALRIEPNSPPMVRQLKEIEKATIDAKNK